MKLILVAAFLMTCAGCQHSMIALETDLPPAKDDRTQKLRRKSGDKFLVPQGTKILSRGVKVTSSDESPIIGWLEMITDGNEKAQDTVYYVELGPGLQWVQLDLGKAHPLYAILVWHHYSPKPWDYTECYCCDHDWPRVYQDVVVQISNDPAFKKDVKTVFNNDQDNSSGLGKGKDDTYLETSRGLWVAPKGLQGRYVRLFSRGYKHGNRSSGSMTNVVDLNQYIEVEVYGK